jgi:hypothetical protein
VHAFWQLGVGHALGHGVTRRDGIDAFVERERHERQAEQRDATQSHQARRTVERALER